MTRGARRPRSAASIIGAALLAVALAGCSPNGPTPSTSASASGPPTNEPSSTPAPSASPADQAAIYREIADQVAALRELDIRRRLDPTILDEAELAAKLRELFDEANPADEVAAGERLLVALGLLEPGASLRDDYLDLQSGQVLGFYIPEEDSMWLARRFGALGATERATFAHEYVHALQDQHFELDGLGAEDPSSSDRALAALALIEGDATFAQTRWMLANFSAADIEQLIADASDPEVLASIERAPAILSETALFPYGAGLQFIAALFGTGGWAAVDAAYDDPPETTEQILHPEKYLAGEGTSPPFEEAPLAYLEAAGPGWSAGEADTLGELVLELWLRENGVFTVDTTDAAAGWGADRVVLFEGPGGAHVVVLFTDWDSAADADEFEAASRAAVAEQPSSEIIRLTDTQTIIVFGTDAAGVVRIAGQVRMGG